MASIEQLKEFLDTVGYIADSDIKDDDGQVYLSRADNSYIARVGMEDSDGIITFALDNGIKEFRSMGGKIASIGFSSIQNKWYGWSHRAIYGFGVGSEVKKGDCAYIASTPEELIDDHANFFADISQESADQHRAECQILDDRAGIRILHAPTVIPMAKLTEDVIDVMDGDDSAVEMVDISPHFTIVKCGKGAWQALTLEDAKLMACDFAKSVS